MTMDIYYHLLKTTSILFNKAHRIIMCHVFVLKINKSNTFSIQQINKVKQYRSINMRSQLKALWAKIWPCQCSCLPNLHNCSWINISHSRLSFITKGGELLLSERPNVSTKPSTCQMFLAMLRTSADSLIAYCKVALLPSALTMSQASLLAWRCGGRGEMRGGLLASVWSIYWASI